MQKRRWIPGILALLLLILPAALYLLSPFLAQKSLQYWLEEQQFSAVELEMQPPSWNRLHIERLALSKTDQHREVRIESGQILLSYNPVELFLNQRVEQLLLPRSDITIRYLQPISDETDNTSILDLSHYLPERWFGKLPVDTLRIGELNLKLDAPEGDSDWFLSGALLLTADELSSRVHFQREQTDLGWADLTLDHNNRISLQMLDQGTPFLRMEGELDYQSGLTLSSRQRINLQGLSHWQEKLSGMTLPALSGELKSEAVSQFPLRSTFSPDALLQSIQSQQQISGTVYSQQPSLADLKLQLQGDLNFSLRQLDLNLAETTQFEITGLQHSSLSKPVDSIRITLQAPASLQTDLSPLLAEAPLEPELSALQFSLSSSSVALQDGLIIEPLSAELSLSEIDLLNQNLHGTLITAPVQLQKPGQPLPPFQASSQFQLKSNLLKQQFSLTMPDLPVRLNGSGQTDINKHQTRLNWQLKPLKLTELVPGLKPYFKLPPELSLQSGSLFHRGNGQIDPSGFTARLDNSIRAADLAWDETPLEGLNLDSVTRISADGSIRDTGSIKLHRVTNGIEATKLSSRYRFSQRQGKSQLTLEQSEAELLLGKVRFADLTFSLQEPDIRTEVQIEALDLGEILKLERQQGLSGEGKLSGSFPLRYSAGEFTVSDGLLNGDAPGGRILFEPTATVQAYAAANRGLAMAIEALRNFHYEQLEIRLNYLADGTALLNTRLKGSNPDWHNGHPVDFTVNIEENIPKLIKTLQFADKLTKTIEKRYR
ncbi:YdbH domain-containing protein [Neptuniibacter halophilus]|uniref:YdbH domain-containing protein n=1 Tax=Neptuniibacter halophilus TaxID=651666 RepID=UPI0025735CB8|nr:YdbH domain-containing protein [Neptuniibacter halophilus]